jgi:hypothetical protein
MSAPKPELTEIQRSRVERAREVLAASTEELSGRPEPDHMATATALGVAQANLGFLLEVIDELTGGAS